MICSKMKYLISLVVFGLCQSYHLNVSEDRKTIGSFSSDDHEISDYDYSKFQLQISTRSDNNKPFESNDLFEGDILNVNMEELIGIKIDDRMKLQKPTQTWAEGIIPYQISPHFDLTEKDVILEAFEQYHKHTCLKFVGKNENQTDYVFIQPGDGGSSVGRQEGKQELNLGKGCMVVGIAQHELMHAVGFWHEQSRPDRDDFITIQWTNIQDGKELNFLKHSWNLIDLLTMSYDVASLMHYGPFAFAKDPTQPTIIANINDEHVADMGQRKHFSKIDIEKINKLYKCENFV